MYPIFTPTEPLKGRDLFAISSGIFVFMLIVTGAVLLFADRDAASIFGVLTGLQFIVTVYGYCEMRKEQAQKKQQQPPQPKQPH
jgi:hypothetical protein